MRYESLGYAAVSFIPPDTILDSYRKDYETMREQMIYAETVTFEEIIEQLKALEKKLRTKSFK